MDLTVIQPLLDWLNLHQQWVAVAILLIAFLESLAVAGVIIPGVVLLFGASAIAGSGALEIFPTLASAFAGAVLGDGVSFFLGKFFQQQIRDLWPFRNYPEWIDNGEAFFNRHGGKSIMIGRFVGPIRPVIPLVAGMLNMPPLRFVLINLISAVAWAPTYVVPGYLFGRSISWGIQFPEGFGTLVGYSLIALLLAFLLIRLSHWQLSHESRAYLALQRLIERQSHARLFWYWFSNQRQNIRTFPLKSLIVLITGMVGFATTVWLLDSNFIADFNQKVSAFFLSIEHPWLDPVFTIITLLADKQLYYIVSGILVSWLLFKRQVAAALVCLGIILLSEFLVFAIRDGVTASRPLLNADGLPSITSFPSGPMTRATVFFGLISAFIAQETGHHRRWWVYSLASIPMLLVGISSLYLGKHWLTDVVGGLMLGLACCGAARMIFSRYDIQPLRLDRSLLLAAVAAAISIVIYMVYHFPTV